MPQLPSTPHLSDAQDAFVRSSEDRFRSVVDSQVELVCRFRADGTISFANAAYARARGTTPQRLVGCQFWDFIPPAEHAAVRAMLERLSPAEPEMRIENVFLTADGERWTLWTNRALSFDAAGRFLEAQSTGIDITDRKRWEQALERSAAHLGALYRLTDRLQRIDTVEEVYAAALDAIDCALACDRASILRFDAAGSMRFVAWRGLSEPYRRAVEGHSPWRPEDRDPQAFGYEDVGRADLPESLVATVLGEGIRALAFIPLLSEGRVIGKFMVYYDAPHAFSAEELDAATTIGRQVAFGLQRLQAEAERRRTEQALAASESRFRMVADSMPAMIGYVDRSLRYRFLNARYGDWFGAEPNTLVGIHMRELLGAELYDARLPYIERVLRGETVRFERASEHPRFGQRATEVAYVAHTGFDGTIEGFYVMGFDVTERKRTEQTLRIRARQQHAVAALGNLALREPDLQQVFEHATRSVAETLEIEYCKILEVLPGSDRLLLRAGVGWKEGLVGHLHIRAGIDSQAGYALLRAGPVVVNDLREERRFTDLTLLTDHAVVSGMTCLITGANGAPWGVIGAHAGRPINFSEDDVSFLAAVANTLSDAILRERAEQSLRENDRRKDEFLAMLSHELRNPLAPLKNSLQVLRLLAEGNAAMSSVQAIMQRQMDHLVRLVDDLLEVSRISRGSFELRRERVELASVVRNAVETSEPHIRLARHRFHSSVPEKPLWLDGDPVRLAQILSNLLNNAAKYTPEGGEIRLEVREESGGVRIAVCDTGIGIRPQALPGIFEMFSRGDQGVEAEGSSLGIGLSVVRRLAQMHGGEVEAHSEGEGCGSEFVLRLPLAAEQAPVVAAVPVHEVAVTPRKILVADDNRDSADSLGMLLEALGAQVQVVHDGVEALEAYRRFQPDVMLLDIGMPGMDGYEVARRIRASAGGGQVLLVAVSGWGKEEDRQRARSAGFDHHLTKPADFDALKALLAAGKPLQREVHVGTLSSSPGAAGTEAQRTRS